jgi:hypothetical protein
MPAYSASCGWRNAAHICHVVVKIDDDGDVRVLTADKDQVFFSARFLHPYIPPSDAMGADGLRISLIHPFKFTKTYMDAVLTIYGAPEAGFTARLAPSRLEGLTLRLKLQPPGSRFGAPTARRAPPRRDWIHAAMRCAAALAIVYLLLLR